MTRYWAKSNLAQIIIEKNLTVSFEKARENILKSIVPLDCESVSIMDTANRILYEDVISDILIPPVDDSAMDGYALISDDTRGASKNNPVRLEITGEIQAGGPVANSSVVRGTAIRIMTGAPLPEGADTVVQFEDTREEGKYVEIYRKVEKHENYRFAGENINRGDKLLRKGDRLSAADAGILASLNYTEINVYKQPTVSIISSGDEIADIGEEIKACQIRNVNAYTLYPEIKKYGGIPKYLGIAKDTLEDMRGIFLKALNSDVVISTGGASTGKYDYVREIYSDLDIEIQFEKVNIKPGRPFVFGTKGSILFFGLPGNPVPVLTSFMQFVRPALLKLMGARKIEKPVVNAVLEKDIKSADTYHMLRGCFTIRNNRFYVSPVGNQKPSVLRSMSEANCLIILPENAYYAKAGENVTIQLIEHDEV